jgi:sterol desaturase/sphingolipid hydroxylase (fatty acid hydroxylase superfamily)
VQHPPINHSDTPIRLFQSDILEFFTHIHPAAVIAIWVPVIALFGTLGFRANPGAAWRVAAGILAGLAVWTLAEYLLHRFLFHHPAHTPRQERIFFLFHGVHHAQPQCRTRLVMPPIVSIPMAAIFYAILLGAGWVFGATNWVDGIFAGFSAGYLIYDLIHYATHHFPMRSGYAKFLKRYHMQHHYKTPMQRFGVSSPVWDKVFDTYPGS